MYRHGSLCLGSLMVQGKLLVAEPECVTWYIEQFSEPALPVTGFGPTGYKRGGFLSNQNGFYWSQCGSARDEIEDLVRLLSAGCSSNSVTTQEILLLTDEIPIARIAVDCGFGMVVYLGERGLNEFLGLSGETQLHTPETLERLPLPLVE